MLFFKMIVKFSTCQVKSLDCHDYVQKNKILIKKPILQPLVAVILCFRTQFEMEC